MALIEQALFMFLERSSEPIIYCRKKRKKERKKERKKDPLFGTRNLSGQLSYERQI